MSDAEHLLGIDAAHQAELQEVPGLTVRVGAGIQHHHPAGGREGRELGGNGGPVDPPNATELHMGGGHHGARVAGRDEPVGLAGAHELSTDDHGRILLAPDRLGARLLHRDDLGGVDHPDRPGRGRRSAPGPPLATRFAPRPQERLDALAAADEGDLQFWVPGCEERPCHDGVRRAVTAHRVNGDPHGLTLSAGLFLLDRENLPAIIEAAGGADMVGQLGRVAARAVAHARRFQLPVLGPAPRRALVRQLPLR